MTNLDRVGLVLMIFGAACLAAIPERVDVSIGLIATGACCMLFNIWKKNNDC